MENPADPGFQLISFMPKPENRMKTYLKRDLTLMLFDENSGSGFYLSVFTSWAARLGHDSMIFQFCFWGEEK